MPDPRDPDHPALDPLDGVLARAQSHARRFVDSIPDRPVRAAAGVPEVMAALGPDLPYEPVDPLDVIDLLAAAVEPGVTAVGSGRFYGFVMGGALPVAVGADWLVSAWDQNTGLAAVTPGVVAAEHLAGRWILDLLGLPASAAVGFTTGCTQSHVACLAAARHHVLAARGWDVGEQGLQTAPRVRVIAGAERHVTIDFALRQLGFGVRELDLVDTDDQGRVDLDGLRAALDRAAGAPTIVNLAAGNVNTGSIDPLAAAIDLAHEHGAWVHVDGAFGLWAAAAPARRHLVAGVERADSWATDAHKWLNVPYDCGVAIVARREAVVAAMGVRAPYLVQDGADVPDPMELVPEFSRRARGVPVWAMLRASGRSGVADLVERCCRLATRAAEGIGALDGARVINEVVLNQVLVRFGDPAADPRDQDELTRAVVAEISRDDSVYAAGSTFRDQAVLRVSVSSWRTTDADIDLLIQVVRKSLTRVREGGVDAQRP